MAAELRLAGDASESKRYWSCDIIPPAVETKPQGTIALRDQPGFGYDLDHEYIRGDHRPKRNARQLARV